MPNLMLCLRIGFRRKNIEAAIDLKGIGIDDFGIELFGKLDRERSFPDRSGTNDEEGIGHDTDPLSIGQLYQRPDIKTNRETRMRPSLPIEYDSTISSTNARSISFRPRPSCDIC